MPDHDHIDRRYIILQEAFETDEFHGFAPALKSEECVVASFIKPAEMRLGRLNLPFHGYCDIQSPFSLHRSRICCGTCNSFDLGSQGRKSAQKRQVALELVGPEWTPFRS
jgi:hypothetical protein